jgi:hypothetical protein
MAHPSKPALTLSAAIKAGKVDEFAEQEDARGVKPVDTSTFDNAVGSIVMPPPEVRQTSTGPSRDGSGGK